MAAMIFLAPLMPMLWILTAVLLLLGVGEGSVDVGGNTLLVWVHSHNVGPFMNGLHFFFGVGAFLSPIIIAQLVLASGDINWAYWALAILIVPVAIALFTVSSPKPPSASGQDSTLRVNHRLVFLTTVFFFLYVGAEVGYGGWVFTYATSLGLANQATAAYLTSAFWGLFTLGRLLAIPISARFRPRTILLVDLVVSLLSLAAILLWSESAIVLWVGTCGVGLAMASIFPVTVSLVERRVTITGRVMSWFFVGASLGGMTLPWLIGQLFESVGPQIMVFSALVAMGLAVLVFGALMAVEFKPVLVDGKA